MRRTSCFVGLMSILVAATAAFAQRSTPLRVVQPGGASGDRFGAAVAIDGDTLVVAADADDGGPTLDQGSAHIYRWTGSGWTFEATLTAADGASGDRFGSWVAISGGTVVVGAAEDNVGSNADQGSAYVFTRSGTTWSQEARLTAADGAANDLFGFSVAIYDDTVIVGAPRDDVGANTNEGSAYVFMRSGSAWLQQAKLTAVDGATSDEFGWAVAISRDTVAVGSPGNDVGANPDQGTVYVFVGSHMMWSQQAQLTHVGGDNVDRLGYSVAISGDLLVAGAPFKNTPDADRGAAYVFARAGSVWAQQSQLTAANGKQDDLFGTSVAIRGDIAIVGAPGVDVGSQINVGSAYVFVPSGPLWFYQAELARTDIANLEQFGASVAVFGDSAFVGTPRAEVSPLLDPGSVWVFSRVGGTWIGDDLRLFAAAGGAGDLFGTSVAISGDTAVVGAFLADASFADQGAAYVFVREPGSMTWTQQAQLFANVPALGDQFGFSVAVSGNTVVVGAPRDDVGGNVDQGSAYVFVRSGTTWSQQAQVLATGGAAGDTFGCSVALEGNTAVVGASMDDVAASTDRGSAYVFVRSGTTWSQQAQLLSAGGAAGDQFGFSCAISGATAIVGAPFDDRGANADAGSVYVFVRSGTVWSQQAQIGAAVGAPEDWFGYSVALGGDTAVVGAVLDDVGANANQGSAYVIVRTGTTWSQQAQLTASDGAVNDQFGACVAVSGNTALVGTYSDDVGSNFDEGSAYVFGRVSGVWTQLGRLSSPLAAAGDAFGRSVALFEDIALVGAWSDEVGTDNNQGSASLFSIPSDDFVIVRNETTDIAYPSLAAALLPALNNDVIAGSDGAWRAIGLLDTGGVSLILRSLDNLRVPSTSTITLDNLSTLVAGEIKIFGQFVSDGANFVGGGPTFLLGSRGSLDVLTDRLLELDVWEVTLQGATHVHERGIISLGSLIEVLGPFTAAQDSLIISNEITNRDTFSMTSSTVDTVVFINRSAFNVFGGSTILGDLNNEAGATTTVESGTLSVVGNLSNAGSIVGTVCLTCSGAPPNVGVGGDLTIEADAALSMPFADAVVLAGGRFDAANTANTRYDMAQATLQFEGSGAEQLLEVMSTDIGNDTAGLNRSLPGHYPIGKLRIGPALSTVRLIDVHDNDGLGQSAAEAIYVDTLQIDAGSRLINTSCKIYYNTLINNGTIDVPANVIQLAAGCPADFNDDGFLDFTDFDEFVVAFEGGNSNSDFNGDGFIDFTDFDEFVSEFEAGC